MAVEPGGGLEALVEIVTVERDRAVPILGEGAALSVGISGSVAVGKSHLAAALADGLRARGLTVEVVGTDGFLLPNHELEARGLALRKGFPESFDRAGIVSMLADAATGDFPLMVPEYDHFRYDVVFAPPRVIPRVDVLIVEGLCLLGLDAVDRSFRIPTLLGLRVAVLADVVDIRRWYRERFVANARRAIDEPGGFWDLFAGASDDELVTMAELTWATINEPNYREHVVPGLADAQIVVWKGPDHSIVDVFDHRSGDGLG